MFYLHYYEDNSGFTQEYWGDAYEEPWVSLTEENDDVNYNKRFDGYLRIEALSSGNIVWSSNSGTGETFSRTIEYCKNGKSWIEISSYPTSYIPVVSGDVVYLRGENESYGNVLDWNSGKIVSRDNQGSQYAGFKDSTCNFKVSGNIMSLIYGDDFDGQDALGGSCNFFCMFGTSRLKSIDGLVLPAKNVPGCAYARMFEGSDIASAIELPATLVDYCGYASMFGFCQNLISSPELPITNLNQSEYAGYTYLGMFQYCSSLVNAPELPATTLCDGCYEFMFRNCTSMLRTSELPATTLVNACYHEMFRDCTSLTGTTETLPALLITGYNCYRGMYNGCYNLETAPKILAESFSGHSNWFMAEMFSGCTKIDNLVCLIQDFYGYVETSNWLSGTSESGTFYKNPLADENDVRYNEGASGYRVPEGWTIVDYQP